MSKAKTFFKLFRPKGGSSTFLQKLLLPFYLSKVQTSKIFCRILLMKNHFSKVQSFLDRKDKSSKGGSRTAATSKMKRFVIRLCLEYRLRYKPIPKLNFIFQICFHQRKHKNNSFITNSNKD